MSQDLREPGGRWRALRADFEPRAASTTLVTGVILGLVNALLTIALVSLIFRGGLATALPVGIGLGLISSAVLALVVAMGSSFAGLYAGVQDASAAIIGLSAASVTGVVLSAQGLDTVLAMVAITSLATGVVFLAMGYLGWGEIARFVPFPVIGGLLAGTGYLILTGSLGILGVATFGDAISPEAAGLLWPALAFAILFFVASRRAWGSRAYLLLLIAAIAGFHLFLGASGVSRAEALDRGWLLGPFPEGSLWPGTVVDALANADWAAIAGEATGLVTVLLILPITLLLYISALEVETKADVDMNRELRATGWANLAAGAVGGPPGYMYLADSVITSRLVGRRRGAAVVAPLAMLAVVALGGAILELLPQMVIGGLLLFVGAEFLYEWLWSSRRRMAKVDYALMWAIVLVIATIGFLPGVAVGLMAATGLFVLRYSRIDVIKHHLNGAEYQSNIERSPADSEYLAAHGAATLILELQGFIFFGTANRILGEVRRALDEAGTPRFVVLDFRRVSGVDSSAVAIFERVALLARDRRVKILITGLGSEETSQFSDLVAAYRDVIVTYPDLDHGLASCEDEILKDIDDSQAGERELPIELPRDLAPYLVDRRFEPGDVLMRQGDPSPGIYLIRSGRATVVLDGPNGQRVRLRTLLGGTVLGEISLYRGEPCTATVVADEGCEVLHLTPESFSRLCRVDPAVAAELHAFVARTLAGRVSHANRTIRALHD
jgi:SulP family sulfate permease